MKNFLIEFFRPLDNLIFNYFVRIGAIKPFLSSILPAVGKFLGSSAGKAIAGQAVSGALGSRSARRASRKASASMERAYQQLRDPSEIIRDAYSTGIYSPELMGTILGRERELIPQFQELAGLRARGVRDIQEESKLRQLDLLGQYGADIRETLEDPRLARLAELEMAEAERLSTEAAAPLSGERAREAEQTALQMAVRQGRGRGQGAVAQAILGRAGASDVLSQQAAAARQRALQTSSAAMVDPSRFLFTPSVEEQIFVNTPLGVQVTDPGMAASLGSATDVQRAQALLGQGLAQAQGAAAQGKILSSTIGGIGGILGNMDFGSKPKANVPSMNQIYSSGIDAFNQANVLQNQIDNTIGNLGNLGFSIGDLRN
jgi:hypothetical protein|tara:strand:- start:5588 stop:6709 length:1122 start_codon:yes stop_codon:yes gene_type:complete